MPLFDGGGFGLGLYGLDDQGVSNPGPVRALPPSYYENLLTSEYQSSPVFKSWLASPLGILDNVTAVLLTMSSLMTLPNAVGPQLDFIGLIVGQARTVDFQPTGGVSATLDDATYSLLLAARIAQNHWDGTIDSLQAIWQQLFPGAIIVISDTQNMAATIILSGAFTSIEIDLIENGLIVPRPQAVEYNYVFATLPIFGFSATNGAFVAGFGAGLWS